MMTMIFKFVHMEARRNAADYCMTAPDGTIAEFSVENRTKEQNAKLWPMLQDVSIQVIWHGHRLTKEEWKDFFSAIILKQRVMPNPEGTGFIAVGGRTSKMSKQVFCELIELMYAFGADHDVIWSDPKTAKEFVTEAREYLDKLSRRVSKESCGVMVNEKAQID